MFSMSPKFRRNKIVPITCGLKQFRNGEIKVYTRGEWGYRNAFEGKFNPWWSKPLPESYPLPSVETIMNLNQMIGPPSKGSQKKSNRQKSGRERGA